MRPFTAMFYRIWLYRKRHYILTLLQLTLPSLIIMLYGASHQTIFVDVPKVNSWTQADPITNKTLYCNLVGLESNCEEKEAHESLLTYYTNQIENEKMEKFIGKLTELFKEYQITLKRVDSESDIIQWAVAHHIVNKQDKYLGGIVFQNNFTHLKYKIKLSKYVPNEMARFEYYHLHDKNYEIYYPLMALQYGIWEAYLDTLQKNYWKPNVSSHEIQMQPIDYPPYPKYDPAYSSESPEFMSTSIVLGMTAIVYSIVRGPCSDKANYFKAYLHTMGISYWVYWSCWFLTDMVVQIGSVGLQILVLFFDFDSNNAGSIVKRGNIYVWTVFLLLYSFACVSFCAFMSTFFKRGTLGTYACATFFLFSYFFSELFYPSHIVNVSIISKLAMCLLPNAALIWGVSLMLNTPGGIAWNNIFTRINERSMCLAEVLYLLGADIIIYYFLTVYADKLRPKIGPPKPWYYVLIWPFNYVKKFNQWMKKVSLKNHLEEDILAGVTFIDNPIIELNFVSKSFQQHTIGLDSTFLRVERGLRTVVVAYKGSGKSTLIHVICGNVQPDSGTVFINGKNIKSLCKAYEISVCFNEDYLFDEETVLEHIILIGLLKGLNHKEAIHIGKKYLKDMELFEKRYHPTHHLLDAERKKLCIILACVGKSDIVLLDDPTEDIEDEEKPPIWDFIMKETRNRTLLMTTSSMDEAKHTGERIVVLERGKIITAGSLSYLRNDFANGYHLVIKMTPNTEPDNILNFVKNYITSAHKVKNSFIELKRFIETREDFAILRHLGSSNTPRTTDLLEKYQRQIEQIKSQQSIYYDALDIDFDLQESVNSEVSLLEIIKNELDDYSEFEGSLRHELFHDSLNLIINLPDYEKSNYYELLKVLENNEAYTYKLGISSWRLREFTLEQAFSEISRFMQLSEETSNLIDEGEIYVHQMKPLLETEYVERLTPFCAVLQRWRGLIIKRILWYWGNWHHFMVQVFIPIILVIITVRGTNYYFQRNFDMSLFSHEINTFPEFIAPIKSDATNDTFENIYTAQVKKKIRKVSDDFKELADEGQEPPLNEDTLREVYIIGVKINDKSVTAMFSPSAFHAGPISLITVLNTNLKYLYPNESFELSSQSQPIEPHNRNIVKHINSTYIESVNNYMFNEDEIYGIMLGFAFLIYVSGFVKQALTERICKTKILQLNTSVSRVSYWGTMMVVDWTVTLIEGGLFLVILTFLPTHKAFYGEKFAEYFMLFCGVAGYALLVQCYIASFIFRRTQTCYHAMLSYNKFAGLFIFVIVITLKNLSGEILAMTARIISPAFCVASGFYSLTYLGILNNHCFLMADSVKNALCHGTFDEITKNQSWNDYLKQHNIEQSCCAQSCLDEKRCKPSEWFIQFRVFEEGSLERTFAIDLGFLALHCILGTFILVFIEVGKARPLYHSGLRIRKRSMHPKNIRIIGKEERLNIRDVLVKNEHLSLENSKNCYISAIYKIKGKGIILSNINLKIKPREILVILGPKYSGKSSLMNILGGISYPSRGDIYYGGVPLYTKHSSEIKAQIGYCPDISFSEKLSGIQYLKLFGRLRGIPSFQLNMHIKKWLTLLRFEKRAKDYIEVYSEGTKAKLRIALALIGDSPILIFDEPTTYLNPIGKATFWRIINYLSHEYNKIIIVASSSVDDFAQNHCKKLGILINGEIKEVMSPSEWKQEYGLSYTVIFQFKELQSKDEDTGFKDFALFNHLKKQILQELPSAELREEQYNFQKYTVPSVGLRWAQIFLICERIKVGNETVVSDYSINETTLKDIYHFQAVKQNKFVPSPTVWEEFSYEYC